jgi:hypothetical protein
VNQETGAPHPLVPSEHMRSGPREQVTRSPLANTQVIDKHAVELEAPRHIYSPAADSVNLILSFTQYPHLICNGEPFTDVAVLNCYRCACRDLPIVADEVSMIPQ